MNKRQMSWRMDLITIQNQWINCFDNVAKRIIKLREKLGMPMSKCPCDPFDENRGCMGSTCRQELIDKGICLCGCFYRTWVNKEELDILLKHFNLDKEDFNKYFAGQTGGIIDDKFYYYPWDIFRYLGSKGIEIDDIEPDLVLLARRLKQKEVK